MHITGIRSCLFPLVLVITHEIFSGLLINCAAGQEFNEFKIELISLAQLRLYQHHKRVSNEMIQFRFKYPPVPDIVRLILRD